MSEAKRTLKQRAFREVKEYFAISLYLFVVFSTFAFYKAMLLAEYNVDLAPQGFALINALALGKVILIAQDLHLADVVPGSAADRFDTSKNLSRSPLCSSCFWLRKQTLSACFMANRFTQYVSRYRRWIFRGSNFVFLGVVVRCAHSLFWLRRAAASLR